MPELTHGPLVGATTDRSAVIWLRANGSAKAQVRLIDAGDRADDSKAFTAEADLIKQQDYTAVLSFTDLEPDSTYHYSVLLDGEAALETSFVEQATFRTFPASDQEAGPFSFAFGSCFIPEVHTDEIFNNLIDKHGPLDPRFFLMLGDNVYVDAHFKRRNEEGWPPVESLLELYREAYRDSWKHQRFRRALMQTPSFMIFDDHEFWDNWNNLAAHKQDRDGLPAAKQAYWEYQDRHNPNAVARHKTADPVYHYDFSYGKDIGFFVLDCRMQRNPNAIPHPTILGDEQRQALYKWLKENKTTYRLKFVVSSVPITFIALPHTIVNRLHHTLGDQWLGFPQERLDLFKFIQHEMIEGVHILSGDIHLGQGLVIEADKEQLAPPVYSYTSSPLAQVFHLLPEETPGCFSTFVWLLVGVLGGIFAAHSWAPSSPLSYGWTIVAGLAVGLLAGAVFARLWRKLMDRRGPRDPSKPRMLDDLLYSFLKTIAHFAYLRKNMGVANDTIEDGTVRYVPKNLFPPVHAYNMGIVTVDRPQPGGPLKVQFKIVNAEGETLAAEKDPHTV